MRSTSDLEQRIELMQKLPVWAHISNVELKALARLFKDVTFAPQHTLVKEGEIIDSLFVIIEGKAVVTSAQVQGSTNILEVLSSGESIGLNDIHFLKKIFHTKTITATTTTHTISLELKVLENFLQTHPQMLSEMRKAYNDIIIYNFIKKLEPFEKITHDTLQQIIPFIEILETPANTILFSQNDAADCCYLLCEGTVDVIITPTKGTEKKIATVESGELLGEMALITESKRNATIKTQTPCKFFVIQRREFQQLVQQSEKSSDALTAMLMDRHRPEQQKDITIHRRKDAEQNTIIILKNASDGTYVKTSEQGLFVWHMLNGDNTLQDIAVAYYYQYRKLAVETIGNLVLHLMRSGFVKTPLLAEYVPQTHLPRSVKLLAMIRNLLQYEYSIKNVDASITHLYQRVGFIFFTSIAKIVMGFIAVVGFIAFIDFLPQVVPTLSSASNAWLLLLLAWFANFLTVPLHELAHALTTKAYGFEVHRLGVGWFWLGPVAFADTSDMWLSERMPRIMVNLSGIYVNTVVSGLMALFALCLPNPTLAVFLWLTAFSSYMMAFYNLDPMFELDGYYVLMDVLDKPNLRAHAIHWLVQDAKKTFFHVSLIKKYFREILYWVCSILFIILSGLLAYFLQKLIFNPLLPKTISNYAHTSHFKWFLAGFVIILSFASLYTKVKYQVNHLHKK